MGDESSSTGVPQAEPPGPRRSDDNLDLVRAIPVELSVRLGSTTLAIQNIMQLKPGAVIELDAAVGRSVDIMANGLLIGQGELVLVNENYGVRLLRLIQPPKV